jgi:hypothetical protein
MYYVLMCIKIENHVQYIRERVKNNFLSKSKKFICTLHTCALLFTYKVFAEYEQILTDKLYE